jgi:hypothetical protein
MIMLAAQVFVTVLGLVCERSEDRRFAGDKLIYRS